MSEGLSERCKRYIARVAGLVDGFIYAKVHGDPEDIYDASLHLIRAGGKRLRPVIVVASAEALGEEAEKALPFAAAVELIHNFTLVHDDIMDRDEFRRGVPTVHKLWGEPMAIIAGDLLFAKAFEVLVDARDKGVPSQRVVEAARVLAKASSIIAEGQSMDMMFEEEEEVEVEEYMRMVYKKTGALFEAAAVLGGLTSTDEDNVLSALSAYGRNFGIAFQIRDDILGLVGDEETIGKPLYSDIREGKKTLLVIYALSKLDEDAREKIKMTLGKRDATREELEEAAELIKSSGAIDYAEKLAEYHVSQALNALKSLPSNEYRSILEELALYAAKRVK
ncbi:MAG: polyprenyl synthetase family protein [Hyperthermus sp.]|nr:MAG: polyprenyl synthetase family protein [Hyperthermus sp.]